MRRNEGVIIQLTSIVGEQGNAFQAVYAASKAGMVAFAKSLAREAGVLNPENKVRVLSVSPGFTETDMTNKIPTDLKTKWIAEIPVRRQARATEIADLIAFLLSEKAAYINGSEIKINGGLS
jgi:3-oxoacyl-[acyl-carrier protein] reductase